MAVLFILSTTNAYAIFDGQAMVGKRYATFTTSGTDTEVGGTEFTAAAHINPIPLPLVSVGFGAAVSMVSWDKDAISDLASVSGLTMSATDATTIDAGLEVMASVSIPFLAEPYARLRYTPYSVLNVNYDATGTVGSVEIDQTINLVETGSTTAISLGLKTSLIPLVSLLFEANFASGSYSVETFEQDSTDISSGMSDTDVSSTSYLIGVEVGI